MRCKVHRKHRQRQTAHVQPSRHEFISASPTTSSIDLPDHSDLPEAPLGAYGIYNPDNTITRIGSSPTLDRHVDALRAAERPYDSNSQGGEGQHDPLGASESSPAVRRTLSSGTSGKEGVAVSNEATRLLGLTASHTPGKGGERGAGRTGGGGRYTDEAVPPKPGRVLGIASDGGAARAERGAGGPGVGVGARRSARSRAGADTRAQSFAGMDEMDGSSDDESETYRTDDEGDEGDYGRTGSAVERGGEGGRAGRDRQGDKRTEGDVSSGGGDEQGDGARWVIEDED